MSKEIMTRKYHRKHYKVEFYDNVGAYITKVYADSLTDAVDKFEKEYRNCCVLIHYHYEIYDRYKKRYLNEDESMRMSIVELY